MGLDKDFLSMLEASISLERKTSKDQWGNEQYGTPSTHAAFIDVATASYGTGEAGGQQEKKAVSRREVLTDAIGIAVDDRVTINGVQWFVTQVETAKDEVGDDLYQSISIENQKKG